MRMNTNTTPNANTNTNTPFMFGERINPNAVERLTLTGTSIALTALRIARDCSGVSRKKIKNENGEEVEIIKIDEVSASGLFKKYYKLERQVSAIYAQIISGKSMLDIEVSDGMDYVQRATLALYEHAGEVFTKEIRDKIRNGLKSGDKRESDEQFISALHNDPTTRGAYEQAYIRDNAENIKISRYGLSVIYAAELTDKQLYILASYLLGLSSEQIAEATDTTSANIRNQYRVIKNKLHNADRALYGYTPLDD